MNNPYKDTVSGVIERVTYFNEENGYSVLKIIADKAKSDAIARDGTTTVVGVLPEMNVGETAEFMGEWRDDPKWGLQFRAEMVKPILPSSERGITRYIADAVAGIGPKTAERIVNHFGEETLNVLNRTPEKVHEVPGIKEKQADALIKTWRENVAERNAIIFLQGFGVTARFARRIFAEYGDNTVQVVQQNPYQLADEVFGVGFVKADAIAQEMGMKLDSAERVSAGLAFALSRLAQDGHTYAPRPVLVEKTAELLKLEDHTDLIDMVVEQRLRADLIKTEVLAVDGDQVEAIYLPVYYHSERGIARILRQNLAAKSTLTLAKPEAKDVDTYIAKILKRSDVQLTDQQQGAVKAALTHKLTVLTGGPGTGKTTTLRMVIDAVDGINRVVALAAPTGRAAKRLSEATGRYASTIHRLLGFQPGGGSDFDFNEDSPLDIDMLVLDETSMLDLVLFYNVLKALPARAHLMLVGDIDQLPSVGAGNVLRDVIDSGVAHVTRLDTIFRQDARSHIVSNAHSINTGDMPYLSNDSADFYFFRMSTPYDAADMVVDLVTSRVPNKFGFDPMTDIQVLAPMYKGPVGVNALNAALQKELNGNRRMAEVSYNGRIYRVGDKVMQTKNNYDKNVFNGDAGRIYGLDKDENVLEVWIDDMNIDYTFNELEQLVLSYCISTHRSQGSEYPVVIMPVMPQHFMMLQRNLLYTAITRAKKLVVLVGMEKAVAMAVNNNQVADRYSGLRPRLEALGDMLF
ncbi:MAG: ATP-dependent RecD-like DNA helicase [Chloroflexota bacterium]